MLSTSELAPLSREVLGKKFWITLIITAFFVRALVAFILLRTMPLASDNLSYSLTAESLVSHFPGDTPYFWPPGFPYLLACVYAFAGSGIVVARMLMALIGVLCVVMTVLFANLVLKNSYSVKFTGWIAALYPPAILLSSETNSESLEALMLILVCFFLVKAFEKEKLRYFIYAGMAYGFGSLVRPGLLSIGAGAIIIFLIAVWRKIRSGKNDIYSYPLRILMVGTATFMFCGSICIAPVLYYNHIHGGGWNISTNNERNFFLGNNPYTPSFKTGQLAQRDLGDLPTDVQAYLNTVTGNSNDTLNDYAKRQIMLRTGMQYVVHHPFISFERIVSRAVTFGGFDYYMSRQIQIYYHLPLKPFFLILLYESGGYCLLVILCLIGAFCAREYFHNMLLPFIALFVTLYAIPYLIAFSISLYHFPIAFLLMPLAGAAAAVLFSSPKKILTSVFDNRILQFSILLFIFLQLTNIYILYMYSPAIQ